MTHITKEEEDIIDGLKDKTIKLKRGSRTFNISSRQIYCYGEVDFNNSGDLAAIDRFTFLNNLDAVGVHTYSNYDYDRHICVSPNKFPLITETWSPAELARFAHGSIGKPERIILFKQD